MQWLSRIIDAASGIGRYGGLSWVCLVNWRRIYRIWRSQSVNQSIFRGVIVLRFRGWAVTQSMYCLYMYMSRDQIPMYAHCMYNMLERLPIVNSTPPMPVPSHTYTVCKRRIEQANKRGSFSFSFLFLLSFPFLLFYFILLFCFSFSFYG